MLVSGKKWTAAFIAVTLVLLAGFGGVTAVIDPYFHYHKPLKGLQYVIENQRYQNNGIVKHFEYDAVVTGTSMSENFKTTEMNEIFGVNAVKVPFSGSSYKEISDNLKVAAKHNPELKMAIYCLDYDDILAPADRMNYDEDSYPRYLYDDLLFNDAEYVFNKEILLGDTYGVIEYTKAGGVTTDFDTYGNWMEGRTFGKEALDQLYERPEKAEEVTEITEEDYRTIKENITRNMTDLADAYPEVDFYLFFSPYSIYFWDQMHQEGILDRQLEAEKYAIELMLQSDNIHLFSFFTEYGMICDLNNYKDILHYREEINSQVLRWMKEGTHELTRENYQEYCSQMKEFYQNYDYDSLFQGSGDR